MTETASEQLNFDEEIFEADIKPHYWVNQSNSLINHTQNLTLTERRIVYSLIALVQPDDKDFKTYILSIKELADLIGLKGNSFHKRVEDALDGLMKKQLVIHSGFGKNKITDKLQWVQRATYLRGTGQVKIKLSDDLSQFLLSLNSYTKYRLINVLRLTSDYSWRIYELLKEDEWKSRKITYKKQEWNSYRILRVTELRTKLDIPNDKLTTMSNFRARVLEVAKKELNQKTDLFIDYDVYKKKGRTIDSFIFYIKENHENKKKNDAVSSDQQSLYYLLIKHGIRRDKVMEFINSYHADYLEANLLYVLNRKNTENPSGYLIKAIEEGYADYNGPIIKEDIDRVENFTLTKIDEQLQNVIKEDNLRIKDLLDSHILFLKNNPHTDFTLFKKERDAKLFKLFESIQDQHKKLNLPPLLAEDIIDKSGQDLFIRWEKLMEIEYKEVN